MVERTSASRPPKRSEKARSKPAGNRESAGAGHGAIGRFSNRVCVRDQVNVSAGSGTAMAIANMRATMRSRCGCSSPAPAAAPGAATRESAGHVHQNRK